MFCLAHKATILVVINTVSINSFILNLSTYYKHEQWRLSRSECWLPFPWSSWLSNVQKCILSWPGPWVLGSKPPSESAGVEWAELVQSPQTSGGCALLLSYPHNSTKVFTQVVCRLKGWERSAENYVLTDPHQSLICQITSMAWWGKAGSQKCHVFKQWEGLFEL